MFITDNSRESLDIKNAGDGLRLTHVTKGTFPDWMKINVIDLNPGEISRIITSMKEWETERHQELRLEESFSPHKGGENGRSQD